MITGGCKYKILAQVGPQGGGVVSVFSHYTMRRSSDVSLFRMLQSNCT